MSGAKDLPAGLRDRIFDAVLAELVESGIDEFGIAAVAGRAGLDRQVIDLHWPDSRVLLMEAMLARAAAAVPIANEGSLSRDLGRFVGSLAGLTGTAQGRRWFRRLLPGFNDVDLSNVGPDFWAFQMAAVEQMFGRAAERGELRPDIDHGNAARMLSAALVYDMVFNDTPMDSEYAEQVYRVILDGLRTSDDSDVFEILQNSEQARTRLRATFDGMIDPIALLETERDDDGHITDFIFREVNPAACTYLLRSHTELLGSRVTETLPDLTAWGLLAQGVHAMETGEPLEAQDFPYFSRRYGTTRRFDLRGARVSADWMALIWRDVSERFREHQHALVEARSIGALESRDVMTPEERAYIPSGLVLRAAADALLEPQVLLEAETDGEAVDLVLREVNQAACDYLGMTREDLLGRSLVEILPGHKGTLLTDYIRCLKTGEPLILNDFAYDHEILQDSRRYDIRATRATANSIVVTWRDITDRFRSAQDLAHSRDLLRAATDAMFDPQALVEVLTTPAGEVDLVLRDVNRAFCEYIDQERADLVDHSMLALFPGVVGAGLMERYVECAETGVPVILDDVEYFMEFLNEPRRFDIRAAQVDDGLISLTVRDTTARFEAAQHLADSEQQYRLFAENAGDLVVHIRDGRFAWVSPSCTEVIGGSPDYWVGRDATEIVPPEERELQVENTKVVNAGGVGQMRHRVQAMDGTIHWVHVHARPFYASDGREDGITAALRVIDDEVAAEKAAREARAGQARADALYRQSMDNAAVGMCLADLEGNFVEVNESLCEFFGYDAATLRQMTWQKLTAADYLEADLANRAKVLAGHIDSYRMVKQFIHADGHPLWGDLAVSCVRDAAGQVEVFIGQITDITAEVQAREQLEQARARQAHADALYLRSMESAAVGMCLARPEGAFLRVNEALCQFFGYDEETLLKKTWIELTAPEYLQVDLDKVAEMVAGRIDSYRMVKQYIHAEGHRIWGDLSIGCLRNPDGSIEVTIGQIVDVTAQMETEQQLERLARVDPLTGLVNRREALAGMETALEPTEGPPSHLGVLFADIDGFKGINDKLGHAAGDVVLKTIASRIRHCVRDSDTVGRMGGDEILVLLPGMPDIDRVTRVAEKIRRHAAEPIRVGGQAITVTLSIGAVLAAPGQTTSTVLARADSAMYTAKAQKNAVASFSPGRAVLGGAILAQVAVEGGPADS